MRKLLLERATRNIIQLSVIGSLAIISFFYTRSASMSAPPGALVFDETAATFAADCVTPKTVFTLGEVVCGKLTSPFLGPPVQRRFEFSDPGGYVRQIGPDVTTDPQTSTFVIPTTATTTLGGVIAAENRGTWRFASVDPENEGRAAVYFSVLEPSTTTLTSSANPSRVGQTVTFTATVTLPISSPTGTVTFTDGAAILCNQVALVNGQATCTTSALSPGAHLITASYSGPAGVSPSSASLTQVVNKGDITIVVTGINPEPSNVNQAYTVTWSIIVNPPAVGTPTGSFTADDGAGSTCTASLAPNLNTYSCQLISSTPGGKQVKVTYSGDANFNSATSVPVVHNVVGTPAVGFEGDINIPAGGGPLGTGDGDVTVADVIVGGMVIRGEVCPTIANPNFQQKFDAGPRSSLGDGLRGSSDVDAIDAYARHDSATDANPILAGWQPTPAGGPTSMSNLGCTPASRIEDLFRRSPDSNAGVRAIKLVDGSGSTKARIAVVDVVMTSDGSEAGTQFSLSWDASRATLSDISGVGSNPDVTLGTGAPSGTRLNVNAENASRGAIGIVEAFTAAGSSNTLSSGARRIVRLTFHIADGARFSASDITFTDDVVRRQTVASGGQDLEVPGGYGRSASEGKMTGLGRPAGIKLDPIR